MEDMDFDYCLLNGDMILFQMIIPISIIATAFIFSRPYDFEMNMFCMVTSLRSRILYTCLECIHI